MAQLLSLQWGHRLSAMETGHHEGRLRTRGTASMGPPPFGDGNYWELVGANPGTYVASMGPPPFGDGNLSNCGMHCSNTKVLQWGHRLSAMETRE